MDCSGLEQGSLSWIGERRGVGLELPGDVVVAVAGRFCSTWFSLTRSVLCLCDFTCCWRLSYGKKA